MSLRIDGRPLNDIVSIPPMPQASSNIEHDSDSVLGSYVPDPIAMDALKRFLGGDSTMSIIGPYGSGKSTFGVLLNCLLSGRGKSFSEALGKIRAASPDVARMVDEFRRDKGIAARGMILCSVTARPEPVAVSVIRGLVAGAESYFAPKYSKSGFAAASILDKLARAAKRGVVPDASTILDIIKSMAAEAPILLMIDEFGKNVEYFTDGGDDGDVFLLQEIAEAAHKIPLHVVTIQHMAFGEYAAGRDARRIKEWAKVQGRFSDVHFANSLEHVRAVLVSLLFHEDSEVENWAAQQAQEAARTGINMDEGFASSCYPLHPFAVDVLPEMCSRYGQNERTLVSFVAGSGPHTVSRFVDDAKWHDGKTLPFMGLDRLYDYFISGYGHTRTGGTVASRMVEIDTIIRDARDLDEVAISALKTIGVLNLVGSSGKLRASMGIIRCVIGSGADAAVKTLERRSIITYRHHADEYRIWHGTDVDIMAKFELWRNIIGKRKYGSIMNQALTPPPIVAARHGMRTGTMRIFQSYFDEGKYEALDDSHDGIVIYGTADTQMPDIGKPVVLSRCENTARLTDLATDVLAYHGVLEDEDVVRDAVARAEVTERLAASEMSLAGEFESAYGEAKWTYAQGDHMNDMFGTASSAASNACDTWYDKSPVIRNEMINRNKLTGQGANARNRIMDAIINGQDRSRLGLEGWSAERAVYEAVIRVHRMHSDERGLSLPKKGKMRDTWNAAVSMARLSKTGIGLEDICETWKLPPYGIKDGILPILAVLLIAVKHDNVAVYEHGTFVHKFTSATAERLAKNPAHFRLKWYANSPARRRFVEETSKSLGSTPGMLGIVSHLVGVVRMLDRYASRTCSVDENSQAVRDVVFNATEPSEMLFTDLPKALGMKPFHTNTDVTLFAGALAASVRELQGALDDTLGNLKDALLEKTHMETRERLSGIAAKLLPEVSSQHMKVFLGALAAEIPDDQEWIKYVALILTDATPSEWNDEHVGMFKNRLKEQAVEFNRLVALNFSKTASEFPDPVLITMTRPDGSTKDVILSKTDTIVSEVDRKESL